MLTRLSISVSLTICTLATGAFAVGEILYWQGDSPNDPTEWSDPLNWDQGWVPDPDDHALVHNYGPGQQFPVIRSDAGSVNYITPSWHPVASTLTIAEGGRLATNHCYLGWGAGASSDGVIVMDGGELYARSLNIGNEGRGRLRIDRGRVEAWSLLVGADYGAGPGTIEIGEGVLIVADDKRGSITQYIADGRLTSTWGANGRVVFDYHASNPGRTTVRACPKAAAYAPEPADGRLLLWNEATGLQLAWSAGDDAISHDVYVGTDPDAVAAATTGDGGGIYRGNQSGVTYTPALEPGTTYYWRVDERLPGAMTHTGRVWSFHVGTDVAVDLYSDTWVATDELGRSLPGRELTGPPRPERLVAMYYVVWFGRHGTPGPYNVTEIIAANPGDPDFVENQPHFWDEPEAGFYLGDDRWVARRNISMLADAGVDILVLEATNGFPYVQESLTLLDELRQLKAEGLATDMKFCFWTNAQSPRTATTYYEQVYSQGIYEDMWFHLNGKPLMLGRPDGQPGDIPHVSVSQEVRDFFTWRQCWAWDHGQHKWQFVDTTPQDYAWDDRPDVAEQVVMAAASHATNNTGKSNTGGVQPPLNEYDVPDGGLADQGLYLAEQWNRARRLDPEILYVTEWNEWIAGAFVNDGVSWGNVQFLGQPVPVGEVFFVDQYNREFNRDLAPARNGYTDNYYWQMVDYLRRHKGVRPMPAAGGAVTVDIDRDFGEWTWVTPEFRDTPGDTMHRAHLGWGYAGVLRNDTGRNDIVAAKVARDAENLYFYARTAEDLTPPSDPNWMWLLIDADQDAATGWKGYDYFVNHGTRGAGYTTLHAGSGGWNWTLVSDRIAYAVKGNELELAIPRALIGAGSGDDPVAIDLHWHDNAQAEDDIREFGLNGDSAPNRRFNYRYQTLVPVEETLVDEDWEDPGATPWGDWDITGSEAYTGSRSLECSQDDNAGMTVGVATAGLLGYRVQMHYKLANTEAGDHIYLWYHDGTNWNQIDDVSTHDHGVWMLWEDVRVNEGEDAKFFQGSVVFHMQGADMTQADEFVWIDDITIVGRRMPTAAGGPYPPDGATGVPLNVDLGWTAGATATRHVVHFGTGSPVLLGEVTGAETADPGLLLPETTYTWRVDEETPGGTVTGHTWTFTTGPEPTWDTRARETWVTY